MGWRELVALTQGTAVRTFSDGAEQERFTYTAAGFSPVAVSGVFRDPHVYVDTRTTVQVSTDQPTLDVRLVDLPRAPRRDDVVTALASRFAGRSWRVVDAQGDGEGMFKLFLVQVSP